MPAQSASTAFLRLEGVGKSFAENRVLVDVDLEIRPGEVLALLGANGAGKSTLVRILAGSHAHDSGRLLIDGEQARFASPHDARRHGIVAVHQQVEQGVVPGLSVAENLLLDELCGAPAPCFSVREKHSSARLRSPPAWSCICHFKRPSKTWAPPSGNW